MSFGVGLLAHVFAIYAMTLTLLLFGFPVWPNSVWIFSVASALLAVALCRRSGVSPAASVATGVCVAVVPLLSAWLCGTLYDISVDGPYYHQEAVIRIAEGWNPLREYAHDDTARALWINHYPKFSWYFGANYYLATGNIEAGKCYSLILAMALYAVIAFLLMRSWDVGPFRSMVLAAMVVANPVVINQSLNYYVDGLVYLCFSLCAAFLVLAIREQRVCWYILAGISGVLLVNTKFTGLPYLCLILAAAGAYVLWTRGFRAAVGFALPGAAILLLGVALFGFDTYGRNFLEHGHPLYPVFGEGAVDIMGSNTPAALQGMGALPRFFASMFHVVADNLDTPLNVRIPFVLESRTEIYASVGHDVRLSGFGFWFSGIFVLSMASIAYALTRRDSTFPRAVLVFLVVSLFITVLVNPESWWARYVPQLWLLPAMAALFLPGSQEWAGRGLFLLITAAVIVNSGVILATMVRYNFRATSELNREFDQLRASGNTLQIQLGDFQSLRARLARNGISWLPLPEGQELPCLDIKELPRGYGQVRYCVAREAVNGIDSQ